MSAGRWLRKGVAFSKASAMRNRVGSRNLSDELDCHRQSAGAEPGADREIFKLLVLPHAAPAGGCGY
jgi:hypothetical protein